MFRWLRDFLETCTAAGVPRETSACLECNAAHCTSDRYSMCSFRQARSGNLKALERSDYGA